MMDHNGALSKKNDQPWQDTLFEAGFDAVSKTFWGLEARLGPGDENLIMQGVYRTQQRHIKGAAILFGLSPTCTKRTRERVAQTLSIDLAILESAAKRIRDGPGIMTRSKGVTEVLGTLHGKNALQRLAILGANRNFWGPAVANTNPVR